MTDRHDGTSASPCDLVVVGASAGGVEVFHKIIQDLPRSFPVPILFITHMNKDRESFLQQALNYKTPLKVKKVEHGEAIRAGNIYVCVPGHHVIVKDGCFLLDNKKGDHRFLPSINATIFSAANIYKEKLINVILSGMLDDGVNGLLRAYEVGALTMVQSPEEALYPSMPIEALKRDHPSFVLTANEISDKLKALC